MKSRNTLVVAFAFSLGVSCLPCGASMVTDGDVFSVKDGSPNNEHDPAISFNGNGRGVIAWTDTQDGIRGRLVEPSGALFSDDVLLVKNERLLSIPGRGREIYRRDPAALMQGDGG